VGRAIGDFPREAIRLPVMMTLISLIVFDS
jgi:hypothetical protein